MCVDRQLSGWSRQQEQRAEANHNMTSASKAPPRTLWSHHRRLLVALVGFLAVAIAAPAAAHNLTSGYGNVGTIGSNNMCANIEVRHPALSGSGFDYNTYGVQRNGCSGSNVTTTCSSSAQCFFTGSLYRTNINGDTLRSTFNVNRTTNFTTTGYGTNYAGSDTTSSLYSWWAKGYWSPAGGVVIGYRSVGNHGAA